jgi:hypothetical protein
LAFEHDSQMIELKKEVEHLRRLIPADAAAADDQR